MTGAAPRRHGTALALAAALGLAALGLAGCDEGPAVTVNFSQGTVVWDDFAYAAQKGPVLVEIHGNPLGTRDVETLVRMVRGELKSAVMGRVVEFTVYPEEAPAPGHRVVLAFDPAADQSGARLCAGQAPAPATGDDGRIHLRAVYCADGQRLSDVQGWIKRPRTPGEDEHLRKLIWQVGQTLIGRREEPR
ncbi:MAG: hypothetical protein H6907_13600 [Hyphomicrobiales bacterium]|nr:hypothetical protein [Hyphomicrobiales bacterium]